MRKKREMQQRKEATSQVVKILYFLFKESTLLIILFVTYCVLIMSKIKFPVKKTEQTSGWIRFERFSV